MMLRVPDPPCPQSQRNGDGGKGDEDGAPDQDAHGLGLMEVIDLVPDVLRTEQCGHGGSLKCSRKTRAAQPHRERGGGPSSRYGAAVAPHATVLTILGLWALGRVSRT